MQVRFSFKVMKYYGRYKESRKAVELEITEETNSAREEPTSDDAPV
jgi:hypothetical protein